MARYEVIYSVENCVVNATVVFEEGTDRSNVDLLVIARYVNPDGTYTNIDLDYDPLVDVNFNIPVKDGPFELIFKSQELGPGMPFFLEKISDYIQCAVDDCLAQLYLDWCASECMDDTDSLKAFNDYLKLKHLIEAIKLAVEDSDFKLADCLQKAATAICETENSDDCGSGC